jgi:hypothetical protein
MNGEGAGVLRPGPSAAMRAEQRQMRRERRRVVHQRHGASPRIAGERPDRAILSLVSIVFEGTDELCASELRTAQNTKPRCTFSAQRGFGVQSSCFCFLTSNKFA